MSLGSSLSLVFLAIGQFEVPAVQSPPAADLAVIRQKWDRLNDRVAELKRGRDDLRTVADVEICAKAADWILRHGEFFEPAYSQWTIDTLDAGLRRAGELKAGKATWFPRTGTTVLAYYSQVDGSVQPFAVTLPRDYDPGATVQWPLYVELHGRNAKLNEVSFFHHHDGQLPKGEASWIKLDIFGRTNNAYRWAGEMDVLEAIAAIKRRVAIDSSRVVLHGFSMGGAGTWHLGLHHPSLWCCIGAGAGFVDTVHHLNLQTALSPLHQKLIRIYDAQEYALNAFNVPTIGYGGELDPQLFAAKTMHQKGQELNVPIQLLIGPETAHKFHPDSLKQFNTFLAKHAKPGRLPFPNPARLKFTTCTVKYNSCDWATIEEQIQPYEASVLEADVDADTNTLRMKTKNIGLLQIARDVADFAVIDGGERMPLRGAAENRLPGVYYQYRDTAWRVLDVDESHQYAAHETPFDQLTKRHDLQGPIDDAFMQPFVCVRPTGTAWSAEQTAWANWTLARFEREFDQRLRGRVPVVNDRDVTDELVQSKHLVLFGDPGSNRMLGKVVDRLPIQWRKDGLEVGGQRFAAGEHGLSMIYPNPLNPRKYLVVNSGHTFHDAEFRASNANLYPRLGDISVIQFVAGSDGSYRESAVFSDLFDARWKLGSKTTAPTK